MDAARYLRVFLAIVLGFGLMHIGSLAAFLYSPEIFYYRPWEFFGDFGYQVRDMPIRWRRPEMQDQTRRNFFLYRRVRTTTVTADDDGFRARRYEADSYPIMVSGDSTIFGSGLSDDETLPWLLAEELKTPVFNAGRTTLGNALAHPAMRGTEVVVDGWTERDINPRLLQERAIRVASEFRPFAPRKLSYMEAVRNVPPQRYSLPLIGWNVAKRIYRDIEVISDGGEQPYTFLRHVMYAADLDHTVSLIAERDRIIRGLGKRYVFLPIPAKQTIYADNVDEYTRNFIPTLVGRLRAQGVEAVDLATPFEAEKDRELFHAYDTHWNAAGTRLAARVLVNTVFNE